MTVKMYTVFDRVSNEAGPVQLCKNDAVASRMFVGMMKKDTINPSDYLLHCIGTFDTETMNIEKDFYVVSLDTYGEIEA